MKLKFDKKYVSLILFLGFSFVLILLIVLPLITKIKGNSQKLLQEKEDIFSFSEEKENLKKSEIAYKEAIPNLEKAEKLFFTKEVPIEFEFINFLEKTASDSDVSIKISSVSSEGTSEKGSLSFLACHLGVSGSFNNFFRFIDKLENNSYLIEIDSLEIKKIAVGTSSEENIEGSISLKVLKK